MKNSDYLLKLAAKFRNKYAQTQSLKSIIENAASYGESSGSGIMNFPAQLKQDQAALAIDVTINGNTASCTSPGVDPGDKAPNYSRLPEQIKAYLDKNLSTSGWNFGGTTRLEWDFRDKVASNK